MYALKEYMILSLLSISTPSRSADKKYEPLLQWPCLKRITDYSDISELFEIPKRFQNSPGLMV
jgi:hypothetical protein